MSGLERIEDVIYDVAVDHEMWIGDDGQPLDYLPEREALIGAFVREAADAIRAHLAEVAGRDEVRQAVANTIPLGWTERDPYRDVYEAADAAVHAYLQAIGDDK